MRREQDEAWIQGKMKFRQLLIVPLIAAVLLFTAASAYSTAVFAATQKERSAHTKKPSQFHYVCPMHEDVTSKKPGTCPKCKMKLVRKRIANELPRDSS
jgi:flagellar basal body-associated protein FliL